MSKIGIFWVYKNTVIGKVVDLVEGEQSIPGVVDSPDTHVYVWESDPEFRLPFSELREFEYYAVPRGRVIYFKDKSVFKIYMDKVLFSKANKKNILEYFDLVASKVIWETDSHYTTEQSEIDDLFG